VCLGFPHSPFARHRDRQRECLRLFSHALFGSFPVSATRSFHRDSKMLVRRCAKPDKNGLSLSHTALLSYIISQALCSHPLPPSVAGTHDHSTHMCSTIFIVKSSAAEHFTVRGRKAVSLLVRIALRTAFCCTNII